MFGSEKLQAVERKGWLEKRALSVLEPRRQGAVQILRHKRKAEIHVHDAFSSSRD